MGRRCEEWFEEDGGDQLETKDAGEETMERNNWASQSSQRVVELEEENLYMFSYKQYMKRPFQGNILYKTQF